MRPIPNPHFFLKTMYSEVLPIVLPFLGTYGLHIMMAILIGLVMNLSSQTKQLVERINAMDLLIVYNPDTCSETDTESEVDAEVPEVPDMSEVPDVPKHVEGPEMPEVPKHVEVPEMPKHVEVPEVPRESDGESVSSKGKHTLFLNKCLQDGQRVKHTVGDSTWIAVYDASKEGLVYNDKTYKKPSGFASDHVKAERPDHPYAANGWTTCKCEVNGKWITLKKHASGV
jgi:hypothetical protein